MARPRKFDDDELLDAALAVAGREGPRAKLTEVAAELDAPVGSLYHRVTGRDELFGRLWLREIGRFQAGLLPLLGAEDARRALESGVRHIPRWCDANRSSARALTLYRQSDLVERTEGAVRERALHVNDDVIAAMTDLARRRYGRDDPALVLLLRVACQQVPYDLVRPHVGGVIPDWLEDAAVAAATAVAARGDRDH